MPRTVHIHETTLTQAKTRTWRTWQNSHSFTKPKVQYSSVVQASQYSSSALEYHQ